MKNEVGISDAQMKEAMAFAKSEAGQQLLALLQRTQGQQLQTAMDQAASGNMQQVKKTLSALLEDPEARRLLNRMGK